MARGGVQEVLLGIFKVVIVGYESGNLMKNVSNGRYCKHTWEVRGK